MTIHYRPIIACGNGLTREGTDLLSELVVSGTKLMHHTCEVMLNNNAIDSEIRARYDILSFDSIRSHVNIHVDPSTGHMLQTLQIV